MIPLLVVLVYLALIACIGGLAYRRGRANTEDFFLAGRSVGSMVFFLSIFATNMTAFAILGSSGQSYRQGIGIFGLMATSSCFVIPLTIFFIGTRLWAVGKKFGHQTQVSFFRDRWECSHIGTVIFVLSIAMLVPYLIISIMGGGRVLADIQRPQDRLLAGLRHRRPGGYGRRVFWRNERNRLGQCVSELPFSMLWSGGRGRHQPRHSRRVPRLRRQNRGQRKDALSGHAGEECLRSISGATPSFLSPPSCFPTWPLCVFRPAA